MSRILKVSQSDYRLQVQSGGNITLDPGSTGYVTIIGNLDVKGTTTQVESTNTTVADNILQLNVGQTGNGISSALNYQAGIEIERGNFTPAQVLFNEQIGWKDSYTGTITGGGFKFRLSNGDLQGIQTKKIASTGGINNTHPEANDLLFDLQAGTGILRVSNYNTLSGDIYANHVVLDDHIPNLGFLKAYIASNYSGPGGSGMAIVSEVRYPLLGVPSSTIENSSNLITIQIAGGTVATVEGDGITVTGKVQADEVIVGGYGTTNQITTASTSGLNLVLTSDTNQVEVSAVLNLDHQSTTPNSTSGTTHLYSASAEGPGRTGIYFVNDTPNADELVSKNRAVLLSILL